MIEKDKANWDQNSQFILDTLPSFLYGFYTRLVEEGFTPEQALELTKTELESFQ